MEVFRDNDAAYKAWLYSNLNGWVVNTERNPKPGYMILHQATCATITPKPGQSYTGEYIKICSTHLYELHEWAKSLGGHLKAHECYS